MSDSSVCKQSEDSMKTINRIQDATVNEINNLKAQAAKAGNDAMAKITGEGKRNKNRFQQFMKVMNDTMKPAPTTRPDLVFFRNMLLFLAAIVIVYYALPRLSGSVKTGFNAAQFQKAAKLPESAFNIEEVAKVNQEVKAFQDHKSFFDDGGAYSFDNAGNREIGRTSVALPMLVFFLQFILPPIAIGYIIWFVITYWPYVINAAWGWYLAMYSYFTEMIQGRLGCKWYIRWVTGWRCRSPNFSEYVMSWRRQYIDGPVYTEKLKYIAKYRAAKERYYTKPFKKYVADPIKRANIRNEYFKKVAMDRTVEVMMKKARDLNNVPQTGVLGASGKMGRVYGNIFGSINRTKQDIDDMANGFDSETVTGQSCRCPAVTDPLRRTLDKVKSTAEAVGDKLKPSNLGPFSACEAADRVINDKASIMGSLIVLLLAILIGIYMFSWQFGTPVFIKNIISHTTYWAPAGVVFKRWNYMPYIIIATTIAILTHTGFAYH
jgi:hypothetical protein